MKRRRWLAMAALLAGAGCLDLSTDPDEIVAIEFNELPWPSIVAGDTLRDSTGAVATLGARLLDGDGDEVTGPVEFLSQDADVRVLADGRVVADDTASGTARLLASTAGLQSIVRQLEIVAAPDSADPDGTPTPLAWVAPDDPALNVSVPLGLRVLDTSGDTPAGVRGWIVTFDLQVDGQGSSRTDTTRAYLVNDAGRVSYADTTDASGRATRRLRLRVAPGFSPPDSAVILVRASYRGVSLTGAPVRWVLPIRPG
ncbi:MAG: hypothetical protein HUU26_05665 [Gemmatimonadaceae bacterium]|nr:hypothetical protein [Gemmatimonadaceae bacterium]